MNRDPSRNRLPIPPPSSVWRRALADAPSFSPIARDHVVDTVVVGGGITGLTLGVLLSAEGQQVALVERARLGAGTTGHTTAHVTEALDVKYATLVDRFGLESARTVVSSVRKSIDEIERHARNMDVDAAFLRVPGYRYSEDSSGTSELDREAEIATELGVDVKRVTDLPVELPCAGALRFEAQAELHPLAYVNGMARTLVASRGLIFEESPVTEIDAKGVTVAGAHRVSARHVVDATHGLVGVVPSIQTRLAPYTSYVILLRVGVPVQPGLFWDTADPYHYVKSLPGERDLVLVGGEDHHTGRESNPSRRVQALADWAEARLSVTAIEGCWSHELFEPADGLPFIGRLPGHPTRLVAAGFSGTGITFGTVAAMLLADLVLRGDSQWADTFSPSRLALRAAAPAFVKENARVAWRFVADRLARNGEGTLADLPVDQGRVVRAEGRQLAVYRDLKGELHFRSATCTHLGCTVAWNDLEKTWDCPCHGGRFHRTGKVMYGPPPTDLADAKDSNSDTREGAKRESCHEDPSSNT